MSPILATILIAGFGFTACQPDTQNPAQTPDVTYDNWPTLSEALACFSSSGPIISAHRGRDKSKPFAENSLSSLTDLHARGFIMAEIDVARLKDGIHILFHDGVWNEGSTGRGPIASTTYKDSQSLLLKNERGEITSDRPVSFSETLTFAKGRLYLEIDFKSSADEKKIITLIEQAGMIDHVALISYSRAQALRLHKLAPNALIAISMSKTGDIKAYEVAGLPRRKMLAWLGTSNYNNTLPANFARQGVPAIYGMFSPRYADTMSYAAQIIVTDFPHEAMEQARLTKKDAVRLADCSF